MTYFLCGQGLEVADNIIYQDNKSSVILEKNGCASSSKCTCHIQLQYFFVKDQVDKKLVHIEYCPTRIMCRDFFTKPLQGALFREQRDSIMNIDPCSKYHAGHRSVLKAVEEEDYKNPELPRMEVPCFNLPVTGVLEKPSYKEILMSR